MGCEMNLTPAFAQSSTPQTPQSDNRATSSSSGIFRVICYGMGPRLHVSSEPYRALISPRPRRSDDKLIHPKENWLTATSRMQSRLQPTAHPQPAVVGSISSQALHCRTQDPGGHRPSHRSAERSRVGRVELHSGAL